MTAKSLRNALPRRNLLRAMGENKKLMIIISILHLLGIPMCALTAMVSLWEESMYYAKDYQSYLSSNVEMYIIVGVICFAAAVLTGMFAATTVFQELWKKSKVDMLYSLPLTGNQRFFSHYLAGAGIYLLPYIAAAVLGWIILLAGSFCIDFDYLQMTRAEFLGEASQYYFLGSLGMFLLMLLYYTSTVLITACCGTYFESIYTTLLFNCLLPGTFAAVLAVICDQISGFSFGYLWHPIGYTSPVGGLIYLVYLLSEGDSLDYYGTYTIYGTEANGHGMIPSYIRWALVLVLLIAVCLIAAWQLYKRRLAESVSKPFVYIGTYHFMVTLVMVCILCLAAVGSDLLGPTILFSAIVYFVMEVIRKRGFKKFWMSAITYIATVAITLGCFSVAVNTEAFSTVYRIPSAASISSVEVSIAGPPNNIILEYTDKETIRAIQDLHKDIVSDMKEYGSTTEEINQRITEEDYRILEYIPFEASSDAYPSRNQYQTVDPESLNEDEKYYYYNYVDYDENGAGIFEETYSYAYTNYLQLSYYTHTGSVIHREYEINADQYIRLLEILYDTDLYAKAAAEKITEAVREAAYVYDEETGEWKYASSLNLELTQSNAIQRNLVGSTDTFLASLQGCYYNDLMEMEPEDFRTSGLYGELYNFPIWNACTQTIELLERYGFRPFTPAEKMGYPDVTYENYFADYYADYSEGIHYLDVQLYAPGDYTSTAEEYKAFVSNWIYVRDGSAAYDDTYCCTEYTDLQKLFPKMYALLDAAERTYYGTEECYMLVVNGTWYAIPPENTALAEEVIALGDCYALNAYWTKSY